MEERERQKYEKGGNGAKISEYSLGNSKSGSSVGIRINKIQALFSRSLKL